MCPARRLGSSRRPPPPRLVFGDIGISMSNAESGDKLGVETITAAVLLVVAGALDEVDCDDDDDARVLENADDDDADDNETCDGATCKIGCC